MFFPVSYEITLRLKMAIMEKYERLKKNLQPPVQHKRSVVKAILRYAKNEEVPHLSYESEFQYTKGE